jgi:hypothetical protein
MRSCLRHGPRTPPHGAAAGTAHRPGARPRRPRPPVRLPGRPGHRPRAGTARPPPARRAAAGGQPERRRRKVGASGRCLPGGIRADTRPAFPAQAPASPGAQASSGQQPTAARLPPAAIADNVRASGSAGAFRPVSRPPSRPGPGASPGTPVYGPTVAACRSHRRSQHPPGCGRCQSPSAVIIRPGRTPRHDPHIRDPGFR